MKADKKENALLKGKVSSQDLIFSVLSEKIKKGILSAGEELKQVELAKSFGVSRMPVREALNRLVAEGYAEKLSNRHIIVRGKKVPLMAWIYPCRKNKRTAQKYGHPAYQSLARAGTGRLLFAQGYFP